MFILIIMEQPSSSNQAIRGYGSFGDTITSQLRGGGGGGHRHMGALTHGCTDNGRTHRQKVIPGPRLSPDGPGTIKGGDVPNCTRYLLILLDEIFKNTPNKTPDNDKDILIVRTRVSMVRGLATGLNRSHRVKATGFIYPGGTTKRLIDSLPGTQRDNKHYKPHFVIVDAGTNDVSAGTTAGKIANEVNELMNVAKDTYPSAEICGDISHVNRTIDTINHNVKEFCNTQNFRFLDNGTDASDPHTTRLNKSGLHLNSKGKRDVADRIITTCLSNGQGARPRKPITNTTVKPQRPTRSAHPHYSRRPMRDKPSIPALMDLPMIPPQQRRPRCPPHGLWMCCPQVNMPHH